MVVPGTHCHLQMEHAKDRIERKRPGTVLFLEPVEQRRLDSCTTGMEFQACFTWGDQKGYSIP